MEGNNRMMVSSEAGKQAHEQAGSDFRALHTHYNSKYDLSCHIIRIIYGQASEQHGKTEPSVSGMEP